PPTPRLCSVIVSRTVNVYLFKVPGRSNVGGKWGSSDTPGLAL
ncbi:hypothetical protein chiPu_0027960, partial [Chiloscyllium punctatum]|nr:hypothetical protein [Chiloscyllium punctatum]